MKSKSSAEQLSWLKRPFFDQITVKTSQLLFYIYILREFFSVNHIALRFILWPHTRCHSMSLFGRHMKVVLVRIGGTLWLAKIIFPKRISLILTDTNSKVGFVFSVGHILTRSSLYGTVHLNCCWEKNDIHQLLMYGAVGKIGLLTGLIYLKFLLVR